MYKVKSFFQFLNESSHSNIIDVILDALEPTILEMIAATEKWFLENFKQEFTEYHRENTRLNLIFDMVKAIEKYTLPTDALVSINVRRSPKGNIEISSQIERDGKIYNFSTEVIYAGGHNIQRLHYRYITKTNIPKTGTNTRSKEYSEKIKRMSKAEKLNNEINGYETRIKNALDRAEVNSKLNDEEIIQAIKDNPKDDWYEWPTWEELVKRDAAKNYNNDKQFYYQEMEKNKARKIEFWKEMNVYSQKKQAENWSKEVIKLRAKLDSLVDSLINK